MDDQGPVERCSIMESFSSYLTSRNSWKTSREEVEAKFDFPNTVERFRTRWEELLAEMQPGDELWYFEPLDGNWDMILRWGRLWGVALVRKGEVIFTLIEAVGALFSREK